MAGPRPLDCQHAGHREHRGDDVAADARARRGNGARVPRLAGDEGRRGAEREPEQVRLHRDDPHGRERAPAQDQLPGFVFPNIVKPLTQESDEMIKLYTSAKHPQHWIAYVPGTGWTMFPAVENGWERRQPARGWTPCTCAKCSCGWRPTPA